MNTFERLSEQARLFAQYHIPSELSVVFVLVGSITMMVIGLLIAVLGAKLARPFLAAGFGMVGAIAGCLAADGLQVGLPLGALIGALVLGISGYVLHRLWVGVTTCVVLGAVAAGSYGFQPVLAHLEASSGAVPEVITKQPDRFTTPDAQTQALHLNPKFRQWAQNSWREVTAKNPTLQRNMMLIAVAAGIVGLLLGLLAVRFTLVMSTSLVGTALLTAGSLGLAYHFQPELYHANLQHPQAAGMACGIFLLGSVILQTLLTRSYKTRQKAKDPS